jgi:hypothetical protein
LKKSNQKTFLLLGAWDFIESRPDIVMPAKAGIHDFISTSGLALLNSPALSNSRNRQKFFAELFFKKATA